MRSLLVALALWSTPLLAQRGGVGSTPVSAAISDVRHVVTFTRALAARRVLHVRTAMTTSGRDPVLLSLPSWTPGAYEQSWFARNVMAFRATADERPLVWDKLDADTWRVRPAGAKRITVEFEYRADSLDNAMAWTQESFAFFNGTNVFLQAEGRDTRVPATVEIRTERGWNVATGMPTGPTPGTYQAADYHELVDMPFFVGEFDLDSLSIENRWVRLATWPRGRLAGEARSTLWDQLGRMFRPMINVFGDQPYATYTNLLVFSDSTDGGSALEHSNSHLGIYTPFIIGNDVLPSITAHEILHLWNVKRMRPVEMWPYRYDRPQPTTLLWLSEGITDYYADLALLRGGIIDSAAFLALTHGKMEEVAALPEVALEDASLSTWIHPVDGTAYIYYPKGSLVGFVLDVLIRDATKNAQSLDQVMRDLYRRSALQNRGFSDEDVWAAVQRAAGRSMTDVATRYVDGRQAFAWNEILPRAGLRLQVDSIRDPRLGVYTELDSTGVRVTATDSASAVWDAGVRAGDYLVSVGAISVTEGFGDRYRARYSRSEGQRIPLVIRRGGREMTLQMEIRFAVRTSTRLLFDRNAKADAVRVRTGLLRGTTTS